MAGLISYLVSGLKLAKYAWVCPFCLAFTCFCLEREPIRGHISSVAYERRFHSLFFGVYVRCAGVLQLGCVLYCWCFPWSQQSCCSAVDTGGSSFASPRLEVGSVSVRQKKLRAEQAAPRGWSIGFNAGNEGEAHG